MNLILQAIILGIIQGLTEFLPISSSGHLIIFQKLFSSSVFSPVALSLVLHLGTLLALIVYFIRDWKKFLASRSLIWAIILATLVTAVLAFPFKDKIEQSFNQLQLVGMMLIATAIILYLASRYHQGQPLNRVGYQNAIIVGAAQALAVIPGLSRSGITMAFGIFSGLSSSLALQFSFLLAIPTILGSTLLEIQEVASAVMVSFWPLLSGFLAAFLTGLLTIHWLTKFLPLNQKNLIYFAVYCFLLGIIILIF